LLPRVRFERHAVKRVRRLFDASAEARRLEICDYLLSTQRFVVGARGLRMLHGWETCALRRLLAGHPDLLEQLAPDYQGLAFGSDAEAILRDLGLIECCRGMSVAMAEDVDYAPPACLPWLSRTAVLATPGWPGSWGRSSRWAPSLTQRWSKSFAGGIPTLMHRTGSYPGTWRRP
jgi:hypothetical protein